MMQNGMIKTGEWQVDPEINFNWSANVCGNVRKGGSQPKNNDKIKKVMLVDNTSSEVTLYKAAIQPAKSAHSLVRAGQNGNVKSQSNPWGHLSSSDEDQANSSDEINDQINLLLNTL